MNEFKPAVQEAPLLKQLLSSSSTEQAAERLWLARLLAAGFQDQTEGDIFRCAPECCEPTYSNFRSQSWGRRRQDLKQVVGFKMQYCKSRSM